MKRKKETAERPAHERLLEFGARLFIQEGPRLKPRVLVMRDGEIEKIDVAPIVGKLGMDAFIQAAAVVARTVDDHDLVAILAPGKSHGKAVPVPVGRSGIADAPILAARSRAGACHVWLLAVTSRERRTTEVKGHGLAPSAIRRYDDWCDPLFYVDPVLENHFAEAKLPGASRQIVPSAPATVSSSTPTSRSPETAVGRTPIEWPWETGRIHAKELDELGPRALGFAPFAMSPAAAPIGHLTRHLAELLERGWSSEAQAVQLAHRLGHEADPLGALDRYIDSKIPTLAKLFACAAVADGCRRRGQADVSREGAARLVELLDREYQPAGFEGWLEKHWRSDPKPDDQIGTVAIACAATGAMWRLVLALEPPFAYPAPPGSKIAFAMAHVFRVRDHLLDRCGAQPGKAGQRIARMAATIWNAVPEHGEPRLDRWKQTLTERNMEQKVAWTLRDYGAFHAMSLHSAFSMIKWILDREQTLQDGAQTWRPDEADVTGLATEALSALTRHLAQRAAIEKDRDNMLRLLERARAVAAWDPILPSLHNEARFRTGAWTTELLEDLAKETASGKAIGACAEYLHASENLGDRRHAAIARRRLREAAIGSAHVWMSEVRITFARPNELSDLERLLRLERMPVPVQIDLRERAAHALYGDDPDAAIAEKCRALAVQREALEWRALVDEVEAEEATAPADRPRPEVPRTAGSGSTLRALGALRFRLDRMKKSVLSRELERHARRASEAIAEDEALTAAWLIALGGEDGLVCGLDADLDEDVLRERLRKADAAIDELLDARWLAAFYSRLSAMWPLLARAETDVTDPRSRAVAIEREAARARDSVRREELERELVSLLETAQAIPVAAPASDETDALGEEEDAFAPMTIDALALERSRRDLDTPEWALAEGLKQIAFFNLARGKRDLKFLRGTRDVGGIWELRHRDARHPVRVMYVHGDGGPRVVAILAKQDDEHQRRMLERVRKGITRQ